MTYKQLLEELKKLSPEVLDQTVTVYAPSFDEYIPIFVAEIEEDQGEGNESGVLDSGHFILIG